MQQSDAVRLAPLHPLQQLIEHSPLYCARSLYAAQGGMNVPIKTPASLRRFPRSRWALGKPQA